MIERPRRPASPAGPATAAVASVRKRIAGTPALYEARALVVDGGEVTIVVRSSTTGFSSLTSGTLEQIDTGTGEINKQFQVTAGHALPGGGLPLLRRRRHAGRRARALHRSGAVTA